MAQKHKNTAERKKEIIVAARKLIVKHGSEHLTIRGLATAAGLSEGAIYRHFRSKRDILSLLVDQIEGDLLGDFAEVATDGYSALEVLDSVLRRHISAIEQRRGVSFQVIAETLSLGDKKLNRKISDTIAKYIARLAQLLSQGVGSKELRDGLDPEAAATLLFGIIQGLVTIWALSNYSFDLREDYRRLWHIFHEAVIKR